MSATAHVRRRTLEAGLWWPALELKQRTGYQYTLFRSVGCFVSLAGGGPMV